MLNRPSKAVMTRVAVGIVALLAALMLPFISHDVGYAQTANSYEYAENGADPVQTYTATDPEGKTIVWSLNGDDAGDFSIEGGVLTFKSPPDFENPQDTDTNNTYVVTVQAGDGGTNTAMVDDVMVRVTNEDEDGVVVLGSLQPQVAIELTAAATDPDNVSRPIGENQNLTGVISAGAWQWSSSASMSGTFTDIDGEKSASYTPDADDVGNYLMATVTYRDGESDADDKTASMMSANPVRARPNTNFAPTFPDQDPEIDEVQNESTAREIMESTAAGQPVGNPVVADDKDDDVLTYSLEAATGSSPEPADGIAETDVSLFEINRATGQISVAPGAKFNHDEDTEIDGGNNKLHYGVLVRATDPFGGAANAVITVNIEVTNVDEDPSIAAPTTNNDGEVTAGHTAEDYAENTVVADTPVSTYSATDPEDETADLKWSLLGPDKDEFSIGNETDDRRELNFEASPDFESPGDADADNVYEVTVVVTDSGANTASRDVTVKVTNVDEDGMVTLSTLQPEAKISVTASLTDPDGDITGLKWQWSRADSAQGTFEDIEGATSATYTPIQGVDGDVGADGTSGRMFLRATATYSDAAKTPDKEDTQNIDESIDTAAGTSANATQAEDTTNQAPVFTDGDDLETEDVVETNPQERSVQENVAANATVGAPVDADDENDNDVLTYSLGGTDAGLFKVDQDDGQIRVGAGTKLDFETKDAYSVMVTATDPSGATATIEVNIKVTNQDEDPSKPAASGDAPGDYAENGTMPVATYMAVDPEGADIVWSLSGDDENDFSIEGGVLAFKSPPDFENPMGDGTPPNNVYNVMVQAGDGGANTASTELITIRVTNVDEDGMIVLGSLQPQVKIALASVHTDPDDGIAGAERQWSRSSDGMNNWSDIDKETGTSYTPVAADVGYYLQLTVNYRDTESGEVTENDKTTQMMSANPVRDTRTTNDAPVFPDQDAATDGNQSTTTTRKVAENTASGQPVGNPVTADDDDVLTYSLVAGTISGDIFTVSDTPDQVADMNAFTIDRATGQIMTKAALDFEAPAQGDAKTSYVFGVRATDPFNTDAASDTIEVTIEVTNVDEDPSIDEPTLSDADPPMVTAGHIAASYEENQMVEDEEVSTYAATDSEDAADAMTWSLSGPDAGKFDISNGGTELDTIPVGELRFKASPNFEDAGDAGADNVYNFTVVVTDSGGNTASRDVTVKVTNMEEAGTVTLSTVQPEAKVAVTATLTDPDGGISGVKWQWYKGSSATDTTDVIEDATSATYTPEPGTGQDGDVGSYLRAQATYTDNAKTPDNPDTDAVDESLDVTEAQGDGVTGVSVNAVQVEDTTNSAPVFPEGDDSETEDVVENNPIDRNVAENSGTGSNVGPPVTATDVETPLPDALTYTLSGPDAALFTVEQDDPATDQVNEGGQIMVGAGTNLDFEIRTDYTVMVTATDPSNASATIMVNITVADVDEVPVITVGPVTPPVTPTISVTGDATVDYEENGTGAVGTYESSEAGATWSLSGEDMDEFSISSGGVLEFTSPPDYEAATDANTDNVYMVTVMAMAAGAEDGSLEVAVTVTNDMSDDETTPPDTFDPLSYDGVDKGGNENGVIDRPEVIQAIRDYFADMITRDDVIAVIQAYFGS